MTTRVTGQTDVARQYVTEARRIVVKVGSSSLTTASGGLDADRVDALVDVLAKVRSGGEKEIVLVSSGAIAAGLAPLGLTRRPKDLARQQAAASVGQGLLVARYTASFARYGVRVGQVLLTTDDTSRRAHYRNAYRTLDQLLAMGALPVVNENDTVATDEIRFGDNDRLAALVAHLVRADLLVLLSDVDGLYDGDPSKPGTSRITEVTGPESIAHVEIGSAGKAGVGTGGMVTKVEAARIAAAAGIPVVLTSASRAADALAGRDTGTYFHRTGRRSADRLLWLAHASTPQGSLTLDDGAVRAVVEGKKSLLAAGVAGVEGDFVAGDPVELRDTAGRAVARGLVNFDAKEMPRMLGRSTPSSPRRSGPSTTARSSTATTWSSSADPRSPPETAESAAIRKGRLPKPPQVPPRTGQLCLGGKRAGRGTAPHASHRRPPVRRARPGAPPRGTAERALTSVEAGADFDEARDRSTDRKTETTTETREVRETREARVREQPVSKLWHITLSVSGVESPLKEVRRGLEQLAHDHPFLLTSRYANDHAEIRYWEEARDLHDAAAVALRLWGEHRQTAKLPPWEIVGLEVIDRETYHQRIAEGYGPPPAAPVGVHPY